MIAYRCLLLLSLLAFRGLFAQNVLITTAFEPNEPSIAIDPRHPNVLMAGTNINNYHVSTDTGATWVSGQLLSGYGVWGDPVLVADTAGDFHFLHLSFPPQGNWIDRIVCQKTTDLGTTWTNGSFMGLNGTKNQDKHWCVVDRKTNHFYVTWTQFDQYDSKLPTDSSQIMFSRSTDGGNTWSPAKRISKYGGDCVDSDNTVEGAVPALGPNGEVYVSWVGPNGLVFNRSLDGGNTWLPEETPVEAIPGGWDFYVPGINRTNGLPVTLCDTTSGPYRGTVYLNWSDQRNGATDTDIWLVKSTDNGNTWSTPVRVNDDTSHRHQFFTWMTIDPASGYLYGVFYDRRNHTDDATDVYLAVSTDGGSSFSNHKISETPFTPDSSIFFGDYTNIVAYNGIIRPIWTRLNNGKLSIWTHLATAKDLHVSLDNQAVVNKYEFETFPNPASQYAYASYKLRETSTVTVTVQDLQGRVVAILGNQLQQQRGKYVIRLDVHEFGLTPGTYFIRLEVNGVLKKTNRFVVE